MSEEKNNNNTNDNDLNELLESALQDFDRPANAASTDAKASGGTSNAVAVAGNGADAVAALPNGSENDAFFLEQAKSFADRMSTLFGDAAGENAADVPAFAQSPEQLMSGFEKMAQAAAMTLNGENPASDDDVAKYSDSIAQALKGLQEGSQNLAAPISENDIANMFGSLNLDGEAPGDANSFLPFMEGMMQSLLSADILLPSINDLLSKYPKYLEENADKLSAEDKERYEKQMELYKVIATHLQAEKPDDSATVKREKFHQVLSDMRKLQELGSPPEEIMAEAAGDLAGLPGAGDAANPQCPTM